MGIEVPVLREIRIERKSDHPLLGPDQDPIAQIQEYRRVHCDCPFGVENDHFSRLRHYEDASGPVAGMGQERRTLDAGPDEHLLQRLGRQEFARIDAGFAGGESDDRWRPVGHGIRARGDQERQRSQQ